MISWDTKVYLDLQRLQADTVPLHSIAAAFALWGGLSLLAVLWLACWWFSARRRADTGRSVAVLGLGGAASVVALLINQQLLSPFVGRVRPCRVLPNVHVLLPCTADHSMPSDHAVVAGALAVGLIVFSRRIGLFAAVIAVLLAFARVYVGVHYPSDVLVGLGVGGWVSAMVIAMFVSPATRLCTALAAGPLGFLIHRSTPKSTPQPEPS